MLHTQTVEPTTLDLLKDLMSLESLSAHYLAGGTALALQIGHRLSVDLDLFAKLPIDDIQLRKELSGKYQFEEIFQNEHLLQMTIGGIKVDIVSVDYPLIKPIIKLGGVRLCSLEDISAMKISAIEQRGLKRDFFDIYFLIREFGLDNILNYCQAKFDYSSRNHILKSLIYFEDADPNPEPILLDPVSWNKVKDYITVEVRRIML